MSGWAALAQGIASAVDDGIDIYRYNKEPGRQRDLASDSYLLAKKYQPDINYLNANAGIRGAVAGARAAGLHPLFALGAGGAGGGSAPAFQISGQSPTGSHLDRGAAMARILQASRQDDLAKQQKKMTQAEVDRLNSETEINRFRLQQMQDEAKNSVSRPNPNYSPANPHAGMAVHPDNRGNPGVITVPRQVLPTKPGKPSEAPGTNPVWNDMQVFNDLKLKVPAQEFSEAMETLPLLMMMAADKDNQKAVLSWWDRKIARDGKSSFDNPQTWLEKALKKLVVTMVGRSKIRKTVTNKQKQKRRQRASDVFVPYSRGPHR
jgi:hypothetical protein